MNLYIFSIILISLLIMPGSFAFGEQIFSPTLIGGEPIVYIFSQIIHRDSDGNLLSYVQSDKLTDLDTDLVIRYMDAIKTVNELPIYQFGEFEVEVYGEKYTHTQEVKHITASTLFILQISGAVNNPEPQQVLAARFAHDGLLLTPGDTITTIFNFAKIY